MKEIKEIKALIEQAFEDRARLTPQNCEKSLKDAIMQVTVQLNAGKIRVVERINTTWVVNEWIKKAIMLLFKISDNRIINGEFTSYFDKIPIKFTNETIAQSGVRVVPPAVIRTGAYIAPNTVLMPSYVNIGAYIDTGTLVDTWATVGSCAQIGKNVHLSGGVGIGGVLEPIQATPTIIEDNCFIGARSEIVEGVIVEEGSVISMGVYLGQSTRIYDREKDEVSYGRIPAGSVVVPGNLPSQNGKYSLYCAVIVKKVDAQTRQKTALNELLREVEKDYVFRD